MSNTLRGTGAQPRVLATDLDGTLLPLGGNPQNQCDLHVLCQALRERQVCLVFVTGRHLASVQQAVGEYPILRGDWIICDVGTTIYRSSPTGEAVEVAEYAEHLSAVIATFPLDKLRAGLECIDALRLQEPEKQGRFKLSFYADRTTLAEQVAKVERFVAENRAPYSIVHSIDPFNGDGLIDLLPRGVSKAYALDWWTKHVGLSRHSVVFAGDSGNDRAALVAGYRAILVSNADRELAAEIQAEHQSQGWLDRLYLAKSPATSGVLEGCRWYGLMDQES